MSKMTPGRVAFEARLTHEGALDLGFWDELSPAHQAIWENLAQKVIDFNNDPEAEGWVSPTPSRLIKDWECDF